MTDKPGPLCGMPPPSGKGKKEQNRIGDMRKPPGVGRNRIGDTPNGKTPGKEPGKSLHSAFADMENLPKTHGP